MYSLVLALVLGCYCLASLVFLHAFALLVAGAASSWPGTAQGLGLGQGSGGLLARALLDQASPALSMAIGDRVNVNFLFRCERGKRAWPIRFALSADVVAVCDCCLL